MKQGTFDLLDLADAGLYQEEFLTLVSHEFRTPLTALKLQAQAYKRMMSRQVAIEPKRLELMIDQIEAQSTKMSALIDLLLELSSWRVKKWNLKHDEFCLSELLSELTVKSKFNKNIPSGTSFKGDRKKIFFAFKILFNELEKFGILDFKCKNLKKDVHLSFKLNAFDSNIFQNSSLGPGVSFGPFLKDKSPLELGLDIFQYYGARFHTKKTNDFYILNLKLKKMES
jgi:hypothetical protein